MAFLTVFPDFLVHLPLSGNDRRSLPLGSHQLPPEQVQIGQPHQQVDLRCIFLQASIAGLLKAELLFDDPENMLHASPN
jgi:hypothetical protein